jgi:hypothetical protein
MFRPPGYFRTSFQKPTIKTATPVDLSVRTGEPPELEEVREAARSLVARTLSDALPGVLSERIRLATEAKSEDVRLRAGAKIVEHFTRPRELELPGVALVDLPGRNRP